MEPKESQDFVIVIATILALVALLGLFTHFGIGNPGGATTYQILVGGSTPQSPGSPGCAAISGEVCYELKFSTEISGQRYDALSFAVRNGTTYSLPYAPALPLGPQARVSILGPSAALVAQWNVSNQSWGHGGEAAIPTNGWISFVLDTGLEDDASLLNATLYAYLDGGWSGAPLND